MKTNCTDKNDNEIIAAMLHSLAGYDIRLIIYEAAAIFQSQILERALFSAKTFPRMDSWK
jgi:hypothetical protein